jgi:hypothetical protein
VKDELFVSNDLVDFRLMKNLAEVHVKWRRRWSRWKIFKAAVCLKRCVVHTRREILKLGWHMGKPTIVSSS